MKDRKTIFIDTETTGVNPEKCGMIQVSGIIDINEKTESEFCFWCSIFDEDEWAEDALAINKKTIEEIYLLPAPRLVFRKFSNILSQYVDPYNPTDKFIAVGYVSAFDNAVLRQWFLKNGNNYFGSWWWNPWIDTMNLAMYMYQDVRGELENFKLKTVAKYAGISVDECELHDASYDIKITRELYYALTQQ